MHKESRLEKRGILLAHVLIYVKHTILQALLLRCALYPLIRAEQVLLKSTFLVLALLISRLLFPILKSNRNYFHNFEHTTKSSSVNDEYNSSFPPTPCISCLCRLQAIEMIPFCSSKCICLSTVLMSMGEDWEEKKNAGAARVEIISRRTNRGLGCSEG